MLGIATNVDSVYQMLSKNVLCLLATAEFAVEPPVALFEKLVNDVSELRKKRMLPQVSPQSTSASRYL